MAALHNYHSCELKSTRIMRELRFNPINPVSVEILSIQSALLGSWLFFFNFLFCVVIQVTIIYKNDLAKFVYEGVNYLYNYLAKKNYEHDNYLYDDFVYERDNYLRDDLAIFSYERDNYPCDDLAHFFL
jgi:hypothetical protein